MVESRGNLSLQGVSGSVTLTIGNIGGVAANTTYSGGSSGSGAVTKAGSSMLTLLGANSYNGLTTISGGTLEFGNGMMGYDGSLSGTGGISNGTALVYDLAGWSPIGQHQRRGEPDEDGKWPPISVRQ